MARYLPKELCNSAAARIIADCRELNIRRTLPFIVAFALSRLLEAQESDSWDIGKPRGWTTHKEKLESHIEEITFINDKVYWYGMSPSETDKWARHDQSNKLIKDVLYSQCISQRKVLGDQGYTEEFPLVLVQKTESGTLKFSIKGDARETINEKIKSDDRIALAIILMRPIEFADNEVPTDPETFFNKLRSTYGKLSEALIADNYDNEELGYCLRGLIPEKLFDNIIKLIHEENKNEG